MKQNILELSEKDLLIRIDERQQVITHRLNQIESKLISNTEYKHLLLQVDEHEKYIDEDKIWKTSIKSYLAVFVGIATTIGAGITTLVINVLQSIFFK